nr:hypothetical protein [Fuerstiella marisgermanici]
MPSVTPVITTVCIVFSVDQVASLKVGCPVAGKLPALRFSHQSVWQYFVGQWPQCCIDVRLIESQIKRDVIHADLFPLLEVVTKMIRAELETEMTWLW